MAGALRNLGAVIEEAAGPVDGDRPRRSFPSLSATAVDCGNAGTVARFLPAAAAVLAQGAVTVDGDARMREAAARTSA